MTILLTSDIEDALVKQAQQQGTTPEILALNSLRQSFVSAPQVEATAPTEGTLADFLVDHIGVLNSGEHISGGAQMSKDTGKKFAVGMVQKRQQGRL